MIGYLAIDVPWSSFPVDDEAKLSSENWLFRVHGYPHPTAFKTLRGAFRAIKPNAMALRHGLTSTNGIDPKYNWGHVRALDLSKLPILRFEDLSLEDRRAIIGERARSGMTSEELARAMLEQTPHLSVPRRDCDVNAIYDELQVAERQMTIWAERCDRLRKELDDVKHMTPVQKARRRHGKDRGRGFNAPELTPQHKPGCESSTAAEHCGCNHTWSNATADEILADIGSLRCSRCNSDNVANGICGTCGFA
jgi:hypothetical protein